MVLCLPALIRSGKASWTSLVAVFALAILLLRAFPADDADSGQDDTWKGPPPSLRWAAGEHRQIDSQWAAIVLRQPVQQLTRMPWSLDTLEEAAQAGVPVVFTSSPAVAWNASATLNPDLLCEQLGNRALTVAVSDEETFVPPSPPRVQKRLVLMGERQYVGRGWLEKTMTCEQLMEQLAMGTVDEDGLPEEDSSFLRATLPLTEDGVPAALLQAVSPALPAAPAAYAAAIHSGLPDLPSAEQQRQLVIDGSGATELIRRSRHQQLITQVYGQRRFVLFGQRDEESLYAFPSVHFLARHSQLLLRDPDLQAFPAFSDAAAASVTLRAGDTLFLPPTMWAAATAMTATSISVEQRDDSDELATWQALLQTELPLRDAKTVVQRHNDMLVMAHAVLQAVAPAVGPVDSARSLLLTRYRNLACNGLAIDAALADNCKVARDDVPAVRRYARVVRDVMAPLPAATQLQLAFDYVEQLFNTHFSQISGVIAAPTGLCLFVNRCPNIPLSMDVKLD